MCKGPRPDLYDIASALAAAIVETKVVVARLRALPADDRQKYISAIFAVSAAAAGLADAQSGLERAQSRSGG